jgi:hypothetical protein
MWQWESNLLEQVDQISASKANLLYQSNSDLALNDADAPPTLPMDDIPNETSDLVKEQLQQFQQVATASQKQCEELILQLDQKTEQLQQMTQEKEGVHYQLEQVRQELTFYQQVAREQLKQKDSLISEYTQTIQDLRNTMEKKQQQIGKLESSVSDLTYEIKTLVQISDVDSSTPISKVNPISKPMIQSNIPKPPYPLENRELHPNTYNELTTWPSKEEASFQLKRFIDTAQKLTGAMHLGMTSRLRDLSIDSYALEQRRLFDSLRNETSTTVLVYSQREDKMLFVNNQIKTLLGWNPDRFIMEFPEILAESLPEWKRSLSLLITQNEIQAHLKMKNRSGQAQQVCCFMGAVPSGIFKNHIIGILT